jgi:rfaE bifunctional protein nucleotidyltransferase chain/domain
MGRILDLEELKQLREEARREGRRFVFTNGCFDILHRGHIELLKAARSLGDHLAVAINSDSSVRRLKGRRRPIIGEHDRAAVLAALKAVDFVVIFEEDTPQRVIAELCPDVLVKGADYAAEEIVGGREVRSSGGEVVRIPLLDGYSTEKIMRRIAARYARTTED